MLVHLGGDVSVLQKKIVAVLELSGELTEDTRNYISVSREEGFLIEIGPPPYKCGVLTADKQGYIFYLSPITAQTIIQRAGM